MNFEKGYHLLFNEMTEVHKQAKLLMEATESILGTIITIVEQGQLKAEEMYMTESEEERDAERKEAETENL